MVRGLGPGENRGHAGVGVPEMGRPVVPVTGGEDRLEPGVKCGPGGEVELRCLRGGQTKARDQGIVELRLQGTHRDETAVRAGVTAIEGCAAVQQIGPPRLAPEAAHTEGLEQAHQQCRAVGHGGVHNAAPARGSGFQQGREHTGDQHHRPAAIVADQIQGRSRRTIRLSHRVECSAERDIVDVMAHLLRHRAGLTPAGDPAIDQPAIAVGTDIRAQSQPLHDAGAEALDQRVRCADQIQHTRKIGRVLEIDVNRGPSTVQHRPADLAERRRAGIGAAAQAQNLCSQIGQNHAGEGDGAEAVELEDAQAGQRFHRD